MLPVPSKLNQQLYPGKPAISLAHRSQFEITQFKNRRFHLEKKGVAFKVKQSLVHLTDFKDVKSIL